MGKLAASVSRLQKGKVGGLVRKRMRELAKNFSSEEKLFSELCFCILTANERAAKGIEIQEKIGNGFLEFEERGLRDFLKNNGYRFYNVRAGYIVEARRHFGKLRRKLAKLKRDDARREWLVENVKGLGWKESSHFLRNVGFNNCAILDRHIIKIMRENRMIGKEPKTLGKIEYLRMEAQLGALCRELGMKQGELDFYLWFMKTGKILK